MKTILAILAALTVAGCAPGQSSARSMQADRPAAAVASTGLTTGAPPAGEARTTPSADPSTATVSPAAGATKSTDFCPPGGESPGRPGCPRPLPPLPRPPLPPLRAAQIAMCGPVPREAGPQLVLMRPAICGTGFSAGEVVTLIVHGRLGIVSWTASATSTGSFWSALPTSACRDVPGTVIAQGNRGHRSNLLPLMLLPCRTGPLAIAQ